MSKWNDGRMQPEKSSGYVRRSVDFLVVVFLAAFVVCSKSFPC